MKENNTISSDLPNSGVRFQLGYYKIEVSILTPYRKNRNFSVENEGGALGLYHSDLFDQLRTDIDTLEVAVREFVEKARKRDEQEWGGNV